MSNFDPNAILRGAQLTVVGAYRALQNPNLFTHEHYRQAALAVAAGIAIRILVAIPALGVRVLIAFLGLFTDLKSSGWDNEIIDGLDFLEHSVLQLPFFLMSFMRYISPSLDNMFMESLRWVDQTYVQKHKGEDPNQLRAMYYPNMRQYAHHGPAPASGEKLSQNAPKQAAIKFLIRYGRKAGISLAVYLLSCLPYIGRFVLPAASFYTFNKQVGLQPAVLIFGSSIFLPKRYLVHFLQSYFASRSLMRELLEPYFSRIRYTPQQKKIWFHDREGVLFGFGVGFFVFLKIPLLGVLIYGIAEASTAFLITKVTDPPPQPEEWTNFAETQAHWRNKHEFLKLPLDKLDALNITSTKEGEKPDSTTIKGRQFT
ncbi:hypothetical protein D6C86_02517 [Aureobasidium pullulans]|uniref:Transmembrane protein UsgS n=1 Tax=Aureobasidium pullulans TaxID=5580 RepID=A0A4S9PVE5_AURPU|nr:hypothetical protein D6D27_04958 [Aureobasidium pullulans]THY74976.1 hypothetical protein D6C94_04457 [Aureobasidium pullulans]THZ47023.1 hypothetical protein D6C87_01727 [Aureobasidium pullulans]THZ64519.1 hypothetical protein D6C86_02517 [Aureobasidium pullulans]THZ64645.1 hypothetical protein D6C88_08383 [Aureobasidium pullulans]